MTGFVPLALHLMWMPGVLGNLGSQEQQHAKVYVHSYEYWS